MDATIIKGMEIPAPQTGAKLVNRGTKFDSIISSLDVGDCVKFKRLSDMAYFCNLMRKRGVKVTQRKIEGHLYVWKRS